MFRKSVKLTEKELVKAFPHVNPEYINHLYTLFYWSLYGVLATTAEEELHSKMVGAFQEFLEKAESITEEELNRRKAEKDELLGRYPKADVNYWINDQQKN